MQCRSNKYYYLEHMQNDYYKPNKPAAKLLSKYLAQQLLQYEHLNSSIISCLQAQSIQAALKQFLANQFAPYSYQTVSEFLCAKVMSPGNTKHEVYLCMDCMLECNSVFCIGCFDIRKHEGHKYQLQQVKGAVCDCGDGTKWSVDTFCDKHIFQKDAQNKINFTSRQRDRFKQTSYHLFKVLCFFYQHFLRYTKHHITDVKEKQRQFEQELISRGLKQIANTYGYLFFKQLNQINKNRYIINKLTCEMLEQKLSLSTYPETSKHLSSFIQLHQEVPLKKWLLAFFQLPKTASNCMELIMILLYKNQQLRKEITIDFLKAYSAIPAISRSPYRYLSPQLLSNSLMVSQLSKNGLMPIFTLRDERNWPKGQEEIKNRALEVYQRYNYYNTELGYLVELKPECAAIYWTKMCQNKRMLDVPGYTNAFVTNNKDLSPIVMGIFNDKYYQLQNYFFQKFIGVVQLLTIGTQSNNFKTIKLLISQLFNKIIDQEERHDCDFLFTYQRMWAVSAYVFLLNLNKEGYFNELEDDKHILRLYQALNITNLQMAEKKIRIMIRNLLRYFVKIDRLFYCREDRIHLVSFERGYFLSNNMLSSIDAIYFKILLRLASFITKKSCKLEKKYLNDCLDIMVQEINQMLGSLTRRIKKSYENSKSFLSKERVEVTLGSLISFVARLQEVLFSELPDIYLSCKFQNIRYRTYYMDQYKRYYFHLAKSLSISQKLTIQKFQSMACCLFFQQRQAFEKFVDEIKGKYITRRSSLNGKSMNLYYLHTLTLKLQDSNFPSVVSPLASQPFETLPKVGISLLINTNAFLIISNEFQYLKNYYIIDKFWSIFVNRMLQIMWTLSKWSRQQLTFHKYFRDQYIHQNHNPAKNNNGFLEFLPNCLRKIIISQAKLQSQKRKYHVDENKDEDNSQDDISEAIRIHGVHGVHDETFYHNPQRRNFIQTQSEAKKQKFLFNKRICVKCDKQQDQSDHDLYQFCFINSMQYPDIFGIQKGQQVLAFTSCQHYCHKNCFKNSISPIKIQKKCPYPGCNAHFNFLLPTEKVIDYKEQNNILYDFISLIFKQIGEIVPSTSQTIEIQIFRAILAFLVFLISVADLKGLLYSHFCTIKRLFYLFKKDLSSNQKSKQAFMSNVSKYKIRVSKDTKEKSLIIHLYQSLAISLNPDIKFLDYVDNAYSLSGQQKLVISEFFLGIASKDVEFTLAPRIGEAVGLRLRKIQNTVQKLESMHKGSCHCSNTLRNSFYLCLAHNDQEPLTKYCHSCCQLSIRKHIIQQHSGQCICVRTDTGEISYFRLQGESMQCLQIESIYADKFGQKFKPSVMELKDKSRYGLRQDLYDEVTYKFYTRCYINHLEENQVE